MEVIELLKRHRSIRKFTQQAIPAELLSDLIEAGQSASTSSFIQATSVVRVSDATSRDAFVELSGGQKYIAQAPEFLVFCADLQRNKHQSEQLGGSPDFGWTEQFLAASVDVALFAQNVVIAAESVGLGACYIGGIRNDPSRVNELLKLPEQVYPVFGLCLGYPDQDPAPKPRLPIDVVLHQDSYQSSAEWSPKIEGYDTTVKQYYSVRTGGKLSHSWSEQMKTQAERQTRPFMLGFLKEKGFIIK